MAYREKLAWLTLGLMLVAYTIYFAFVGPAVGFGQERLMDVIWSFGWVAAGHGLAALLGFAILFFASGREGRGKPDERDRAIQRRGATAGYGVLLTGMILVGVAMPFSEPPWKIVNTALLAIVVAEVIKDVVVLVSYRRGWSG